MTRTITLTSMLALAVCLGATAGGAAFAQDGTLQIYSAYPDEQMRPLIAAFNKVHPDIKVEVSVQPGEELLSTIELELRANKPQADVVGLNQASLNVIQTRHKALEAYQPAEIGNVRAEVRDDANIVVPACFNPYLIQYNTNKVKAADAPKAWTDLLDPKWKGQIAMADPAKSQSVHSFIWFISTYMAKTDATKYGWPYFEKLKSNDIRLESSHGTIRDLTASGERPIGVQLLANGQTSANRGDPTEIVWPKEGSPGEISGFAMFSGSDNKPAAKAWLDFIVTKAAQAVMPNALGCAPIRNDVDYKFPGGTNVGDVKLIPVDSDFITQNRSNQTKSFNKAMGR